MESHERKGAIPAIDNHASRTWHFPTNLARRQYQYDIIQQALCQNSLIALPTGLGKTFIAAVIMYNYYRWFPSGRIIFMAPTRPLVTQQLEATLKNVEIDARQTVEMTGGQSPTQREQLWRDQRVFFLTPQVLQNDLTSGICDARQLVLLVFDEAHRALGNHAYCDVVRLLTEMTDSWRVRILALTATPASNVETVQQIIDNLLLSKIIIRSDESPDVKPYVHGKTIETVVVPESADINFIRTQFESHIVKPYLDKLVHLGVFNIADPAKLGSFQLLSARDSFRKTKVSSKSVLGAVEGLFAILISLYHSYDLLILHGITAFKTHLMRLPESTMHQTRLRHELDANPFFVQLLAHIESKMQLPFFVSHPKIDIVEHKLLQHFTDATGPTRAIVFSQYRESVYEIILEKFKVGGYNVLVATCIGEEGLDIGNVDLIICFDMQSSPIRMLQRIGRTGRHRDGRIILLLSAGREEQRYQRTLTQHRTVQKAITNANTNFLFYRPEQRILLEPPVCIEREFNLSLNANYLQQAAAAASTKLKKKVLSNADSTTSFVPIPVVLFSQTRSPVLDRYVAWQRSMGASFIVPHSRSTARLCNLLKEFEALDPLPLGPTFLPRLACAPSGIHTDEQISLIQEMEDAIVEMGEFERPSRVPIPWDLYGEYFQEAFPSPQDLDDKNSMRHNIKSSLDAENPLYALHNLQDVPDNFFDDSVVSCASNSPLKSVLLPLKVMTLEPNVSDQLSNFVPPVRAVCQTNSSTMSNTRLATDFSSPAPLSLIQRRQGVNIIATSSMESSPVKSKGPSAKRLCLSKCKYFDYEASCSDDDAREEDHESMSASLAAFIDDRTEVTEEDLTENDKEDCSEPPSSEGMMAFYRRTAFQSQVDPQFTTAPRQFASKTRLNYGKVYDDTSGETTTSSPQILASVQLEDVNWSSDLDL